LFFDIVYEKGDEDGRFCKIEWIFDLGYGLGLMSSCLSVTALVWVHLCA